MSSPDTGAAEQAFREAFERLKRGCPVRRKKGAKVTQNNVAKEAGRDPSALRKARYPSLIRDIKAWVEQHGSKPTRGRSPAALLEGARKKNRDLLETIAAITLQRDLAVSRMMAVEAELLELVQENSGLRGSAVSNVVPIGSKS